MAAVWERQLCRILFSARGRCTRTFAERNLHTSRIFNHLYGCRASQFKTFLTSCALGFVGDIDNMNSIKSYTDEDWRKKLSPEQYHICREKGTERPWSGELLDNKLPGIYSCVCCDADLFNSSTKFDSESGWPSFWSAIEHEQNDEQKQLGVPNLSVDQLVDNSAGMVRVEVLCNQCGSHLGHVFSDGPKPTGLRYCINSLALKFKPSVTD